MATEAWRRFDAEIALWRDAGRAVEFWWRDDDATHPSAELARLLALAAAHDVPLALAVVPDFAVPELFAGMSEQVSVLQHGVDHRNRAAGSEKKTEFSASEPPDAALARLAAGRARLETLAAPRFIAVLAPPWNRLPATLVPGLSSAGLHGLTTYGARAGARPAGSVSQINTHVDIIAWRSGRSFVGEPEALGQAIRHLAARRTGNADPSEPTGWLTHHACHDEAAWKFLGRLFEATLPAPGVFWRRAPDLFDSARSLTTR